MAVLSGERLHTNMDKLLPGARSAALLWQGAALAGGLALGAGQVYGGAAPFGLALVISCPPAYCLAAAVGTLAAGIAFQPALLGIKLGAAAVAAATVRRLIDERPKAGLLAGCLTLAAAQLVQIILLGGLVNFSQTVTVGCTALLAAGLGCAFAHFPAREPRGVCLWLAAVTACLQRCAVGPLAPGLPLPGRTLALCRGVHGGLHGGGIGRTGCRRCAAAGRQCRGGHSGGHGRAGRGHAQNFSAARTAGAGPGVERRGPQAGQRGRHLK